MFVIPYLDVFTLIGTTDVPCSDEPEPAAIAPMETEYLCDVVNRAFQRSIKPADVVWSFSGIRALQDDGSTRASAVTRDYALDLDAPAGLAPVLSIVGGKLTTYRVLAEQALEKLAPFLGPLPAPWTGSAPLPGGDIGGGTPMRSDRPSQPPASRSLATPIAGAWPAPTARAPRGCWTA